MGADHSKAQMASPTTLPTTLAGCWKYEPHNSIAKACRDTANIDGKRNGETLSAGAVFSVSEEVVKDGVMYLKLADGRGWVFDHKPGEGIMCVRVTGATLWKYVPDNGMQKSIRAAQGHNSERTDARLSPGEIFHVIEEVVDADGTKHLKLADGRGWVFEHAADRSTMCIPMDGRAESVQTNQEQADALAQIEGMGAELAQKNAAISQHQFTISQHQATISQHHVTMNQQQLTINEQQNKISELERTVAEHGSLTMRTTLQMPMSRPVALSTTSMGSTGVTIAAPPGVSYSMPPFELRKVPLGTPLSPTSQILSVEQRSRPIYAAQPQPVTRSVAQQVPTPYVRSMQSPQQAQDVIPGSQRSFSFQGAQPLKAAAP